MICLYVLFIAFKEVVCVVNKRKIEEYLTYLVHREIIHEGQKRRLEQGDGTSLPCFIGQTKMKSVV